MSELPTVALSIMQPWAWLISHGHKDIENRDWKTRTRGPVLIHAGKAMDAEAEECLLCGYHPVSGQPHKLTLPAMFDRGGIVGRVDIVDCVLESASPWFVGAYGFVLANAQPLPLQPCKGALGFFRPDFTSTYAPRKRRAGASQPVLV